MTKPLLNEEVKLKWKEVIEAEGVSAIRDPYIRNLTIRLLENQANQGGSNLNEWADGAGTAQSPASAGAVGAVGNANNYDPVMISLVRRTAPSLIAHELMGVQAMSGPTGLIFAMRVHASADGGKTFSEVYGPAHGAPDPTLSGKHTTPNAEALGRLNAVYSTTDGTFVTGAAAGGIDQEGGATAVTDNSLLTVQQYAPWNEMTFTIDRTSVEAQTRALKAQYTTELAQDLRAIHGLDAETELANLLSGEITAEINREIINIIKDQAIWTLQDSTVGTYSGTAYTHATSAGFDFYDYTGLVTDGNVYALASDSGGRWEAEHWKNVIGIINRVAHEVALGTRRGLGNRIITNPVVAAALDMVSKLDPARDVKGGADMNNDNVGVTYAGRLLGRYDVYVDPYMVENRIIVGYKGANAYDAGYYYCPYVPLTMMRATGENDFQPRIGFKTRYGVKPNPYVHQSNSNQNWYYRQFVVTE